MVCADRASCVFLRAGCVAHASAREAPRRCVGAAAEHALQLNLEWRLVIKRKVEARLLLRGRRNEVQEVADHVRRGMR
eukprot:11173237-Lingulodinium_polyedra.AAC.2